MRNGLFIWIMVLPSLVFAQNWDLFPHNASKYYFPESTTIPYSCKQDSSYVDGIGTHYYFNEIAPDGISQTCYDSINTYHDFYTFDHGLKLQLISIGDSVCYYNTEPLDIYYYGTNPAVFMPFATVGSTWTVVNNAVFSEISTVYITCDSVGLGSFLGLTDSLKYYSVTTDSIYPGSYTIDKALYILSKHYGLIKFLPFYQLLGPSSCPDCFKCYNLIGWETDTLSVGYTGIKWEDWIHLAPGDFLKWHNYMNSEFYNYDTIHTQLIQTVNHYADSIVITALNESGELRKGIYYKADFYNSISQPYWRLNRCPERGYDAEPTNLIGANNLEYYQIDSLTFPGVWMLKQLIDATAVVDDTWCTVGPSFEHDEQFGMDSYMGMTYHSYGDPMSYSYERLIGYNVSGVTWGEYWPLTINGQSESTNELIIAPNPAGQQINIQSPFAARSEYFIFDLTGKHWKTATSMNNTIDISGLPAGTYFLEEKSPSGIRVGKFIKL